jgi:ATP-dependent exoDNAse (exonuclease V) beta subunit
MLKKPFISLTDNINLLYVAFTRAEQQLLAWCPAPADTGIKSCSSFLKRILEGNEKLQASFHTASNELSIGDPLSGRNKRTGQPARRSGCVPVT